MNAPSTRVAPKPAPHLARSCALTCVLSLLAIGCSKLPDMTAAPVAPTAVPAVATAPAAPPANTSVGTEIDDTVVTAKVKSALLADQEVRSFEIKVETRKGLVQLSGFVDSQARIDSAIALARRVEGVRDVENGMTVKDGKATVGNTVDDAIITGKVKSALLSDAAVKSADVAVVTRKGVVQLSGYVGTQAQIDHAVDVSRAVEGVVGVNNEMSIKK